MRDVLNKKLSRTALKGSEFKVHSRGRGRRSAIAALLLDSNLWRSPRKASPITHYAEDAHGYVNDNKFQLILKSIPGTYPGGALEAGPG